MSIARVKASSLTQGLPKQKTMLAGNSTILPGSYESIQTVNVGSGGTTTITFSSIPSTYSHLQVRVIARSTGTSLAGLYMSINSSVDPVIGHYLVGDGSTVTAAANGNKQYGWAIGSSQLANTFTAEVIDILDYANTNKNKTVRSLAGYELNGSGGIALFSGLFNTTVAINALNIYLPTGNLAQYSSFALYGIK
jgi:hypothetical protein